jgi:hypothetical protein
LAGAPITIRFDPPLTDDQLRKFVKYKLRRRCGIWGNPLWRGKMCQLYGLDLADNARIDLQMDTKWFTAFIHDDTPASVIVRLVENVKKYLTSHFTVYAGEKELVKY